jgi:prepilin signal peptidase PulO-like enzyme (type II secretory pathway)
MMALFLPFAFIFGTIIGSFLNVAALRYNSGRSIGGRSSCFSCRHELAWYELIPVLSFLSSGGRCRSCRSKISWQYPLVELATGILFACLFAYNGLKDGFIQADIFWAIEFALLIVITIYDYRHKIIPDGLVYAFSLIALLGVFYFGSIDFWSLIAGPLLFLPFFLLWFVSKGRWIGLGDGKLALGIGWALGAIDGGSAIVLGFWIGALVSLAILAFGGKRLTIKSEVPFGPFLILGFLLIFFFRWDILGLHAFSLLMN